MALERVRGHVQSTVDVRDQWRFLQALDALEAQVSRGGIDPDGLTREIQNAKDTTRRTLRQRPVQMSQILASLDGLEQEVLEMLNSLFRGK